MPCCLATVAMASEDFAAVFGTERVGEFVEDQDSAARVGGGKQGGEDEVDGEQFLLGRVGHVVVGEHAPPGFLRHRGITRVVQSWSGAAGGRTSLSSLAPSPPAFRLSASSASLMAVRALRARWVMACWVWWSSS